MYPSESQVNMVVVLEHAVQAKVIPKYRCQWLAPVSKSKSSVCNPGIAVVRKEVLDGVLARGQIRKAVVYICVWCMRAAGGGRTCCRCREYPNTTLG
ncbi:hypothetical protein M404DRAFT_715537 [Pisolithus tinctorius Marx 270]|uniref:Uncharacterized protein n=1 Tax=Pisolithus tinctorius Marx 270 TaxID=870435 RepID=A0A0C3P3Z6_PISTI|nr:hypothetical protein M404DRAFT_715537 [Pisolithus tinctorius Marx 270]